MSKTGTSSDIINIIKNIIDNENYEGYWHNDKKQGNGKLINKKENSVYEGEFKNDLKDGIGKITYFKNGSFFINLI